MQADNEALVSVSTISRGKLFPPMRRQRFEPGRCLQVLASCQLRRQTSNRCCAPIEPHPAARFEERRSARTLHCRVHNM